MRELRRSRCAKMSDFQGFIHEPILGFREVQPGRTPLDGGPNPSRPWPTGQGGYPLASALWVWGLEGEEPAWPQDRTAARPQSREPGHRTIQGKQQRPPAGRVARVDLSGVPSPLIPFS